MKAKSNQPNLESIPRFSLKSALIIFLAGILGGVIFPYVFFLIGWNPSMATMLFLPPLITTSLIYSQFFIERKKGICKRSIIMFVLLLVIFEFTTYIWLYKSIIF